TSGLLTLFEGTLAGIATMGGAVSIEDAARSSRDGVLKTLGAINFGIGNLVNVTQISKVVGFISTATVFDQQHVVLNGASEFLGEIFQDRGIHARSAVGVAMLPMNAPVEVEMIVKVAE